MVVPFSPFNTVGYTAPQCTAGGGFLYFFCCRRASILTDSASVQAPARYYWRTNMKKYRSRTPTDIFGGCV